MLQEMFLLLVGSNPIFAVLNPVGFGLICVGAVALACALWWLCNKFTGLWNRSFYWSWFHHVACVIAALCTIFFIITFASVGEIGHVLDQAVTEWGAQMHEGSESGARQLAHVGDTSSGNASGVPSIANNSALMHQFETTHPFLREVLHSSQADADGYLHLAEQDSPTGQTIDRVAAGLKDLLQERVRHVVILLRSILFLSFMLVQGTAFALTGYAAHRNIRPCV